MILRKLLNLGYYTQDTSEIIKQIRTKLLKNKLILNEQIYFKDKNNKLASYNFADYSINIPKNFYRNDNNFLQLEFIQKSLGDKAIEFIIRHEIGHLNHHQFLSPQPYIKEENFAYTQINYDGNYIGLDKLFDRNTGSPIEDFLHTY